MSHSRNGFKVVEMVVTIVVSGLLILSIFQVIGSTNNLSIEATRRTIASNIAYNNMRKYANGKKPMWFQCIGDDASETTPPFSDGKTKPNATGQVLMTITSPGKKDILPAPVTETVIAVAPYGCGSSASGLPIRVQSQVTYGVGTAQKTITHATYVTY